MDTGQHADVCVALGDKSVTSYFGLILKKYYIYLIDAFYRFVFVCERDIDR